MWFIKYISKSRVLVHLEKPIYVYSIGLKKYFLKFPRYFQEKNALGFLAENFLSAALAKDNSKTNYTLVFKHRNKFTKVRT